MGDVARLGGQAGGSSGQVHVRPRHGRAAGYIAAGTLA